MRPAPGGESVQVYIPKPNSKIPTVRNYGCKHLVAVCVCIHSSIECTVCIVAGKQERRYVLWSRIQRLSTMRVGGETMNRTAIM